MSVPVAGQLLCGTVISTRIVCPGGKVPLAGLKLTPFNPLLVADQLKLTLVEVLVRETKHIQNPVGSRVHCWLAKMVVGLTDKMGAAMTERVTLTVKELAPILKVTVPVYIPTGRCAFRFEAVMVTLADAPAFKVLPVGLANSQFALSVVCALADQAPSGPQLVIATVCTVGSLALANPVYFSAFGVPLTQPACTKKDTGKDSVTLFGWLVKVRKAE
jgi:hypothetical protein